MDLNGGAGAAAGSGKGANAGNTGSPYFYYIPAKGRGGDGGDGGSVGVNAYQATLGDVTISGAITAKGGAGGQGSSSAYGGGPGGAGGSGGVVAFWGRSGYSPSYTFAAGNVTISGTFDLSGNAGGAGGSAAGAGMAGGSGGRGGSGGSVRLEARGYYASAGDLKILADVTATGGAGGAGGNSTSGAGGWSGSGGEGGPGGGSIVIDVTYATEIGSIAMSGNSDLSGGNTGNAGNGGGGFSGGTAGSAGSGGSVEIYAYAANILGDITLEGTLNAQGGSAGAGGNSASGSGGGGGAGGGGGRLYIDRTNPYGGGGNVFALAAMDLHSGAAGAGGNGTAGYGGGFGGPAGNSGSLGIYSGGGDISLGNVNLSGGAAGNAGAGGYAYSAYNGGYGGSISLQSAGGTVLIGVLSLSGGNGGRGGNGLNSDFSGYGGAGGSGGNAGSLDVDTSFTMAGLIASGGNGGAGGNATSGTGGAGGKGGDAWDVSFAGSSVSYAIANGGAGGDGGSSLSGSGGAGGNGGSAGFLDLSGVVTLGEASSVGGSGGLGGAGTVSNGAAGYAAGGGGIGVAAPGSLNLSGNITVAAGSGNDGYGGLVQYADGMLSIAAAGSVTQTNPASKIQVDNLEMDISAAGSVNLNNPSNIVVHFTAGMGASGAVPGGFSLVTNSIGVGDGLATQGNVIATGDVVLKNPFADGTLGAGIVQSTGGTVTLIADNLSIGGEISSPTSVTWTTANDRAMGATQGLFDAISAPMISLGGATQTQNIALVGGIDFTGSTTTTLSLKSAGTVYQPDDPASALTVQNLVAKGASALFPGANNVANLQIQATAGDAVFYNEASLKLAQIDTAFSPGANASGTLFLSSGGSISAPNADGYFATGAEVLLAASGAIGSAAVPLQVGTQFLYAQAASGIDIATNKFSPKLVSVGQLENTTSGDLTVDAYGGMAADALVVNNGGNVTLMTHSPLSVLAGVTSAGDIVLSSSGVLPNDIKLDGTFTYSSNGEFIVDVGTGGLLVLGSTYKGVITQQSGGLNLLQLAGTDSTVSQSLNTTTNANEVITDSLEIGNQETGSTSKEDEEDKTKRRNSFGACKP